MKRKILSILLCFSIITVPLPASVFAAPTQAVFDVENVKTHVTLWGGTHYFTYTINGVEYDSRTTGSRINLMAWKNMNSADKSKVSDLYYPGTDRTEQLGEEGVQEIVDYVNDRDGWTHAWKVMHDRAQKWCEELIPYYGGVSAEDDPDRYYNEELERLTNNSERVNTVLTAYDYRTSPETDIFREKYIAVCDMMATGKAAYDNCVKCNEQARDAAVKATSAWLIKFIVDNLVIPSALAKPSATAAGVDSAMDTVYEKILSMVADITDTQAASMSMAGNINNTFLGGLNDKNISLKQGANEVKRLRELAEKNYNIAKYCHEQAVLFSEQLESEAEEIIKIVDARKAKEEQDRETARKLSAEQTAKTVDVQQNTEADTERYEYIEKREDRNEAKEAAFKKLQEDTEALLEEITAAFEAAAKKNGFEASGTDSDTDWVSLENKGRGYGNYNIKYLNLWERAGNPDVINSAEELKELELDKNDALEYYITRISMIESYVSDEEYLYNTYIKRYEDIVAREKALMLLNGYGASGYESKTGAVYFALYGMARTAEIKTLVPYFESNMDEVERTYEKAVRTYNSDKEEYRRELEEYLTAQTNYHLAYARYADLAKEQKEMIYTDMPDYVYTQPLSLGFGGIQLKADSSNTMLINKINAAEDKHAFFRNEAEKFEEFNDKYNLLEYQMNVAYNYTKYYMNELEYIWQKHYMDREGLEAYGIQPRDMRNITDIRAEFKIMKSALPHIEYDDTITHLTGNLLYLDFIGMGAAHKVFLDNYNEMKMRAGYFKRKIASGEMSVNEFSYSYVPSLTNYYNLLNGNASTPLTYTGSYTRIGHANEVSFSKLMYGDKGIISEITSAAYGGYVPVTGISKGGVSLMSADGADLTLNAGDKGALSVTVEPSDATETAVLWTTDNAAIADVDENGVVTANGAGIVTIRAMAADAPIEKITGETGSYYYDCPDEFTAEFTVTVTDDAVYDASDVEYTEGYSWQNYGTEDEPQYINVAHEDGKTAVSMRFKAGTDGLTLIMAVYDENGVLLGADAVENRDYTAPAHTLSVQTNGTPSRVKVFLWAGTDTCEPYSEPVFDEEL